MSDLTTEGLVLETLIKVAAESDWDSSRTLSLTNKELSKDSGWESGKTLSLTHKEFSQDSDSGSSMALGRTRISEPREVSKDPSVIRDFHPLRISPTPNTKLNTDYAIQKTLGEGGMGVVRLARQNSLDREVALKELQPDHVSSKASARLIHEAQISGRLEHPNIVPIHDLGRNPQDQPVMVMKRIEGTSWQEMLDNEQHYAWENIQQSRFDWNLGVLIDVCRAVEFAHSRNIIHRDIKPENIMIGSFGEVYLLDWGLGYDLTKRPDDIMPNVAGTPAYMAPEMLKGLKGLGKSTDVYLLGGCLYQILTGLGPHASVSVREALNDVLTIRNFDFPEEIPEEIVQICKNALAFDKEERTASVAKFRGQLRKFLMHRTSNEMMRDAMSELRSLQLFLESSMTESDASLKNEDAQQRWTVFNRSRFGFEQALKQWPENVEAKKGLTEAVSTMAQLEIVRGRLQSAEYLYAELENPPTELKTALTALRDTRKKDEARRDELEKIAYAQDPRVGALARLKFLFYFIPLGSLMIPAFYFMESLSIEPTSNVELLQYLAISCIIGVPIAYRFWDSLYSNARSRILTNFFILFTGGLLISRVVGVIFDRPGPLIVRDEFIFMAGIYAVLAMNFYSDAWTIVAITLTGILAMEFNPARIFDIFILVHVGVMVMIILICKDDLRYLKASDKESRSSSPPKSQ